MATLVNDALIFATTELTKVPVEPSVILADAEAPLTTSTCPLALSITGLPLGNVPDATKSDVLPPAGKFVRLAALPSGASTSEPIARPKLVLAAPAELAPVPP